MVDILCLEITGNAEGLGVTETGNLEGNLGGRFGLDLEGGTGEGVVLGQQVVGRLSEVLEKKEGERGRGREGRDEPSRKAGQAEGETWWTMKKKGKPS